MLILVVALIWITAAYFVYELRKIHHNVAEINAYEARRRETDLCYWHAQLRSVDVRMRKLAGDMLDCLVGDRPDRNPADALSA
jgi:hypothetical protein